MDTRTIIEKIQASSDITEVAKVTMFEGHLEGAGTVEITIRDRGEGEQYRYSVYAETKDVEPKRTATSNPERELEMAIGLCHWGNLSK